MTNNMSGLPPLKPMWSAVLAAIVFMVVALVGLVIFTLFMLGG